MQRVLYVAIGLHFLLLSLKLAYEIWGTYRLQAVFIITDILNPLS
jgi:hypothetical protein